MMSHSHHPHPHPQSQPRRLPKSSQKERSISVDSSFSSSTQFLFPHETSSPTTTTSSSSYSFNSKSCRQQQHFDVVNNHNIVPCRAFNVRSRPWGRSLKFLFCSSVSVMASTTQAESPTSSVKKKHIGQQKKQELEKEVYTLRKMLDQEEKVHDLLQRVHHRQDGSLLHIPSYVPPKMKELLAELAMVEDEITRLESQISGMQTDLNREKEVTEESKSKQVGQKYEIPISPYRPSSTLLTNPTSGKGNTNENQSFDQTNYKALHFISKAIKGDYNILSGFSIHDRLRSPSAFSYHKESNIHDEVGYQERIAPRKSGILKPPSPLRDPRYQTPKKERNVEFSIDLPQKAQPSPIQSEEESIHKWSPNKLSENIMKCLIFIYVRLLRTSRAVEIEKSGPISRSSNFSLSFRAEPSLNSKASLMLQKESRQQDPYGIFNVEESIPRDIGSYKNLVRFTSSCLEPKCISNSSYVPLLQKLRAYMNGLQKVDLRLLTSQQKLAFWINMYNACIMHGFLQYGVPSSPEKLLALMNKATLNIGGNTINAQAIEHFILRKPATSSIKKEVYRKGEIDDNEKVVRSLYGLEPSEPNITFSLCCGTHSSPAVRIYTGDGVVAELDRAKLEYLQASIIVKNTRKIAFPELLLRNMHDFARDMDSLIEWVCHQLPTSGSLRKSMVDCFRGINSGKISSIIEKIPYEFEFQYLLSM